MFSKESFGNERNFFIYYVTVHIDQIDLCLLVLSAMVFNFYSAAMNSNGKFAGYEISPRCQTPAVVEVVLVSRVDEVLVARMVIGGLVHQGGSGPQFVRDFLCHLK